MSAHVPRKILPSGAKIPVIGLGVYKAKPGAETYNAVLSALKLGYRHIDTAQGYQNEVDVGRAVRDSGFPREEVFVTSKLFISNWGYEAARATTIASNDKLGLGYIDLFLLHAPGDPNTRAESWRALEELHEKSILQDIGVSNFGEAHLEKLLNTGQVLHSTRNLSSGLRAPRKLEDPTVLKIANEVGVTPAQVLLAFSLANGFIALPKSVNAERQKANLDAAITKLTPTQVAKLAALDEDHGVAWDPIKTHAV
ncbi:hypothetical protein PHYPSEUDO_005971 [Phytophthora pseudosyringae]|uniref:NADP-dependent oxidoreductase domain-containing protein n=1 Tax=Phytophthora pseudosyringae TaxID=221518 RepID=A0A8T1VQ21_9STRA|nr:hypothetical protein PHYPSEUDO_005971 [Phytophthora pseudosyringae]